jgi:hypothetical protein
LATQDTRYIIEINVTLNVTLGYLASSTNVTLCLERSDGNDAPMDVKRLF